MIKFFCDANEAKQQTLDATTAKGLPLDATTDFGNGAIDKETFLGFQKRYRHILGSAETACRLNHKNLLKGSTKLPAGTKTKNLVRRLRERETEVLLFFKRGLVPLTKNKAEQALRMTKVHEKVSGCCQSIKSLNFFRKCWRKANSPEILLSCSEYGITLCFLGELLNNVGEDIFVLFR